MANKIEERLREIHIYPAVSSRQLNYFFDSEFRENSLTPPKNYNLRVSMQLFIMQD